MQAVNGVGVVCALAAEARHLGPPARGPEPVRPLADGTLLAVSGMGLSAASRAALALVSAGATALASWGMAGGLDPSLRPGTIFLPDAVLALDTEAAAARPPETEVTDVAAIAHGQPVLPTDPTWRTRLATALAAHPPLTRGKLLTSPRAIGTLADKAAIFRTTQAIAVDMESYAIAQVARAHQLPFIAVRVIVDSAQDALPRAVSAAADAEGHLHVWRLLGALARAPGELPALIRLGHRYRAANRSLAAVARVGLS